jgi:signal transduction histidine kinase
VFDLHTLRGRLALGYALAVGLALLCFAAVTLIVLDAVQRATLDDRLRTAAGGVLAIVDTKAGRAELDDEDRRQFTQIVGAAMRGAVLARGMVVATTAPLPVAVRAVVDERTKASTTVGNWFAAERVLVRPVIADGGATVGTLVLWEPTRPILALDARLALAFAVMIPALALVAVLAGSGIARRGLRPLDAMSAVAAEIEGNDLSRRIETRGTPDELARLASAFNRMLDRLEAAFARERRFTADASHEVRAPLSVIRAEADLALMRERSGEEYRATLERIAREADRLEALTRDLLAVARAEVAAPGPDAVADLAVVASDVVDRLRLVAEHRGSTLGAEVEPALVRGDAASLARVTVSLVQNALKHGRPGGAVTVGVRAQDDWATLVVRDQGDGFSPEALEHGLERFWQADPSRTGEGAGLGLAIAQAVVAAAGGSVALANARDGGAEVTVRLQRAFI